jgi:carboxymethylenebutenolidase
MSMVLRRILLVTAYLLAGLAAVTAQAAMPPAEAAALERLSKSPRHGEWVVIEAGGGDRFDAWVVYPERSDKAPVVLVIHEIFGLSDWVRSVADQLAADGFLAIAPDFLSGKAPGGQGSRSLTADQARGLIPGLKMTEVVSRLDAAARYGTSLPAATEDFGVVGYCWGGGIAFTYATEQPDLDAAVVYYGTSPSTESLARVRAPVLGLYGGDDARVNATVPAAEAELKRLGKRFEAETYAGAGHGFLRQQEGRAANLAASEKAWPRTIAFLRETLVPRTSSSDAASAVARVVEGVASPVASVVDCHDVEALAVEVASTSAAGR